MPQVAPIIGQIALSLAASVANSVLSSVFTSSQTNATTTIKTARGMSFEMAIGEDVPVSAVLGVSRARGQLFYHNEYGTDNEYLQFVVKVGHGEHDGLEKFLVDERVVTLAGANSDPKGYSVTEYTISGTPYLWVKYYTGAAGQAADAELVSHANPPTRWTSAHKMTGCAYFIVTLRYNSDLFGTTVPKFGSVWRGLKLPDWRNPAHVWGDPSTYAFTKNPVVMAASFRRGIYVNGVRVLGMGYSAQANDTDYFTAAANRADETHYDPETNTTIPVFEFGREVGDDEDKMAVLQELEASWCGTSFKRGGAYAPLPAQQLTPVLTLGNADRLLHSSGQPYPVIVDRKGSVSAKKTIWHGQFVSETVGWGLAPFTPRINAAFQSVLGGDRAVQMNQPYESNQVRAQLRAEIALRRQLYPATRVETFGPKAFVLEPGDPITRHCEWGSMLMIVERRERLQDGTGVTLTLREWNNSIVPASGDSFVTLPSGPGAGAANPDRTIAVSGLSVVPYSREGGGAVHPCAKASWTQITDPKVDEVMIRLWPSGGTEADDALNFFADAKLQNKKITTPLSPLTQYTYKAIPIRSDGRGCVWTNTGTFTTGAEVAPAVADGIIDNAALSQELKNVTQAWPVTLFERLDQLELQIGDLAQTVMDGVTTKQRQISGLLLKNSFAQAAVVRLEEVVLGPDGALAQLSDEVVAIFQNQLAGGAIRFKAEAGMDGAESQVIIQVWSEINQEFYSAGTMWQVFSDTSTRQVNWADQIVWTDGTAFVQPAVFQSGTLYLDQLKVAYISSPDGSDYWDLVGTDGWRVSVNT